MDNEQEEKIAALEGLPYAFVAEALKFPDEWERLAKLRDGINTYLLSRLNHLRSFVREPQ